MNAAWKVRRRNVRLWRAIRKGKQVLRRNPDAAVRLPDGLVMISYEKYEQISTALR